MLVRFMCSFIHTPKVVNSPPAKGYCISRQREGFALNTSFQLECKDYTDDAEDMPLQYGFDLLSDEGATSLVLFQGSNIASVLLPAGNHTIVGKVMDKHGAIGESFFTVEVLE
jgi:hypothetical protein